MGETLRMEYVPGTADVQEGDLVVTSGIDGIYPKGFPVGKVESATRPGHVSPDQRPAGGGFLATGRGPGRADASPAKAAEDPADCEAAQ